MPDETWESASVETPESIAPAVDPPVVDLPVADPPAETSTLETTEVPQLEAETPARESESQETQIAPEPPKEEIKDEDVKEGDTPEILALPSKSSARQWARRQFHDAAPIRDFLDFDKPITGLGNELYERSPSRYSEHVRDLIQRHLGVAYEDAKARLEANVQPVTPPPATEQVNRGVSLPTEAELAELDNAQAAQRIQQVVADKEAALRAEFEQKFTDLKQQFEAVNGKVTTHEQQAQQAEIMENQTRLLSNVLTVVDDGIRISGLEVQPTDPPKIANLKRAAVRLLDKQQIIAAFDAIPENAKLAKYAQEAISRREYQNAFREEDNLKVRARAVFESVKQTPEVKTILDEIEAYYSQSKGNSRAPNPVPPAPGSSVGINVKPPTTWDEAVGASA